MSSTSVSARVSRSWSVRIRVDGVRRDAPRTAVERVARVALERRRQARPDQPTARHAFDPYRRRTASAASIAFRRRGSSSANMAELLALAEVRRGHAEEPDLRIPRDLRARELERRPVDRLGEVGRLRQRPLPR